jgi:hypothetical protein
MLVFIVGSSGGSALLSRDHARFVAVPQWGQKNPDGAPQLYENFPAANSKQIYESPLQPCHCADVVVGQTW